MQLSLLDQVVDFGGQDQATPIVSLIEIGDHAAQMSGSLLQNSGNYWSEVATDVRMTYCAVLAG